MAGAGEVWAFVATCPPGVDSTAPIILELAMPPRTITSITVEVPPGPSGAMGWALGAAGAQMIPVPPTQFVVTDKSKWTYELPGLINSGAWEAQMYNTGQYEHSIYIYFTTQVPDAPPTLTAAGLIAPATLDGIFTPPVAAPAPPPPPVLGLSS